MKKRLALILVVMLICSLAGIGTAAYFRSQATSNSNDFVAGTLILGSNDGQQDIENKFAAINFDKLEPGTTKTLGTTVLKNVGTLPFTLYRITASNISAVNNIDDFLTVKVSIGEDKVYEGKLSGMTLDNGGYFEPIKNIDSKENIPMTITVTMDPSAGNIYQGKSIKCDLTLYAQQTNKPIPGGNAKQLIGTSADQLFSLSGSNNNGVNLDIDWLKNYDSRFTYKDYVIHIKNETDKDDITVKEFYIKIKYNILTSRFELTDIDGIKQSLVDVNPENDIVRISANAFPSDWKGFQVKVEGRRDVLKSYDTMDWSYWSLQGLKK